MSAFKRDLVTTVSIFFAYFTVMFCCNRVSEYIGIEFIVTILGEFILAAIVLLYLKKRNLLTYYGLNGVEENDHKRFLYYIPLFLVGIVSAVSGFEDIFTFQIWIYVIASIYIGFFEELLYRGLLLNLFKHKGMIPAVVLSSFLFGGMHLINIFSGKSVFMVFLQVVYAGTLGFALAMTYIRTNSIIPGILAHIFLDAFGSLFKERNDEQQIIFSIITCAISIIYGLYLLRIKPQPIERGVYGNYRLV